MNKFLCCVKKGNVLFLLIAVMILIGLAITVDQSYGADNSVTKSYSFKTNNLEAEYMSVEISGSSITVSGRSMLDKPYYRVIIRNDKDGVSAYWGKVNQFETGGTFSVTFDTSDFSASSFPGGTGDIVFRASDSSDGTIPGNGYTFQGVPINYSDMSHPYLMTYDGIVEANNKAKLLGSYISPKAFLDVKMLTEASEDGGRFSMTTAQADYLKDLSDRICIGANDSYHKLLQIYGYITNNFYYDYYAFHGQHYKAQVNPYNLCYGVENGEKVKTVCDGFSATFTALARAQGIPARLVVGHAVSTPQETWATTSATDMKTVDHVWSEAYVNEKWITVDATRGTSSMYYNPQYKTAEQPTYNYLGTSRYSEFDLTDDGLSNSKLYFYYKGGPYSIGYVAGYDKKMWGYFLSKNNGYGKSNGSRINSAYSSSNPFSWKSTVSGSNMEVSPEGRITKIGIKRSYTSDKSKLLGSIMNLNGMSKLTLLTCYNQNLTGLYASGCTSLKQVSLNNNNISKLDLTASRVLTSLSFTKNPATSIKFRKSNGSIVSISGGSYATVGCTYTRSSNRLVLYAKPNLGYKLLGIYASSGKRVTTKTSYSTSVPSVKYTVKCTLNPYSYKYKLSVGNNQSYRKPYTIAAQKRLKVLGYYSGTADGVFDSGVSLAVKRFSKKNGFSSVGYINDTRWKRLFSTRAKRY